ncbi:hypothetical protein [Janthinobacterium sp. LB2P10]|uniref:hypothetical protein n=1 Tax=Janthinobacterium sp. LB2P10 TaxID=3424194 RepID=UPI003F26BC37
MKLSEYLAARGNCKALTRIEAEAFGVPYPLTAGWPRHYGQTEITPAMIKQLRANAGGSSAAAARALRGLDAGTGVAGSVVRTRAAKAVEVVAPAPRPVSTLAFPGFRLRDGRATATAADRAAPGPAGRPPWE